MRTILRTMQEKSLIDYYSTLNKQKIWLQGHAIDYVAISFFVSIIDVDNFVDKCVNYYINNLLIIPPPVVSVVINRVINRKKCRFPQLFAEK